MRSAFYKSYFYFLAIIFIVCSLLISCKKNKYPTNTTPVIVNNYPPTSSNLCDSNNRPHVNAQLIPIGTLSQARNDMTVATVSNKILFAGGQLSGFTPSSQVDIYDLVSQTWSSAQLSIGRYAIASAVNGNKVFFGGGETSDGTWPTDTVDIYDATNNSWSTSHLSVAGNTIAAAAVGDKVLFAGGDGGSFGVGRETRVDIFNLETGIWSTSQLSEVKRGEHAAVTVGNKIYIGGGETWPGGFSFGGVWGASSEIDIYDNSTNSWSTASISKGKLSMAAISVGQKIYWAGGRTGIFPSVYDNCDVDVMDASTGTIVSQNLFRPATWDVDVGQNAVLKNDKIIFLRLNGIDANKFDIYNISTDSWSIGVLPQPIPTYASVISVNNTIYIAGGNTNQVYILQF